MLTFDFTQHFRLRQVLVHCSAGATATTSTASATANRAGRAKSAAWGTTSAKSRTVPDTDIAKKDAAFAWRDSPENFARKVPNWL